MSEQVYARVVNGKIVEYPVYPQYIAARGQTLAMYTLVQDSTMPEPGEFQYVSGTPTVLGSSVYMQYTVLDLPFESLLAMAWGVPNINQFSMPNAVIPTPPAFSSINPALASQIQKSATARVQQLLDQFAQTKGYDSMASACSYSASTIASYAAEGATAIKLRDETWSSLYSYLSSVESGASPLPKSFADIQAKLPTLSW